jgi:hypothetical protein
MYLFRLLVAIWLFGLVGTTVELLFLEHIDGILQLIPLILLALAIIASGWYLARPDNASLAAYRATLGLLVISGFVGLYLHYRGNVEFEKEREPTIAGFQLIWEALRGATPALAPGTMIFLALIGYALTLARRPEIHDSAAKA